MAILVVDNYDSFVFNLVQYLGQLGVAADVWRNDDPRLSADLSVSSSYDGVLLSPGPGTPERAGVSVDLVRQCAKTKTPLLGVCLGHQAIGVAFGASVDRAGELLHGKTSLVSHDGSGVMAGLSNPFVATRYHSLTVVAETIPDELIPTGRTESGLVMTMRHRDLPIHGVQFHPESVMTDGGHRMLANWLDICGIPVAHALVSRLESELAASRGTALKPAPR